ncbi:hypothetical protein PQQ87_08965 [Paraburkholderia nemoris]|uniref:hypothetical protein n=1 Tax=Paraburkholderia nemoris TaxID=2793076 RepID=UPI0038BD1620
MNTNLATEFEHFFAARTFGQHLSRIQGCARPVLMMIAVRVFTESAKRTVREDHAGLFDDALTSVVTEYVSEFADYLREHSVYRLYDPAMLIKQTVTEMHELFPHVKPFVNMILQWRQEAIFDKHEYTSQVGVVTFAEHPMNSFTHAIGIADVTRQRSTEHHEVERQLAVINAFRAGNAFLKRSDWIHRIITD